VGVGVPVEGVQVGRQEEEGLEAAQPSASPLLALLALLSSALNLNLQLHLLALVHPLYFG